MSCIARIAMLLGILTLAACGGGDHDEYDACVDRETHRQIGIFGTVSSAVVEAACVELRKTIDPPNCSASGVCK